MAKAIGYARVSTKHQSVTTQEWIIRGWAESQGLEVEMFSDFGVSSEVFPRKGLNQAFAALHPGDFFVHTFDDRLTRDIGILLKIHDRLRELEARAVRLDCWTPGSSPVPSLEQVEYTDELRRNDARTRAEFTLEKLFLYHRAALFKSFPSLRVAWDATLDEIVARGLDLISVPQVTVLTEAQRHVVRVLRAGGTVWMGVNEMRRGQRTAWLCESHGQARRVKLATLEVLEERGVIEQNPQATDVEWVLCEDIR